MKRSDAEHNHNQGYKSIDVKTVCHIFKQRKTMEEINQKTLTVRDQFAITAMQSLTPIYWEVESEYENGEALIKCQAETAYQMADAMMEARNK